MRFLTPLLLGFFLLPSALAPALAGAAIPATAPAATQAAATLPADPAAKIFNAESFTLENGLQVVVIPNHRVPVVTHMVWYRVGAADETPGHSGLAHYLEHLMFKGSPHVAPGEFSRRVKVMGGQDNAFTSYDYTAYYQTVTTEHLPEVMEMEADRMRAMLLPESEFEAERDVVIEERRQRTENDPSAWFSEYMDAALFVNHPYGRPVIGWMHEIRTITRADTLAFHDKWYAPNNAILVVSGDITAAQLRPLAEKTYGKVPAKEIPARDWMQSPPLIGEARLVLHDDSVRQTSVQRAYRVPSFRQNAGESYALQVLESILSDGATTRLYKSLVVDRKIATSAGLSYNSASYGDATLWMSVTPAETASPEEAEAAFDAEMRRFIAEGPTETELAEAKQRMKDRVVYAVDSVSGPAMIFGRALAAGASVADIESWPARIDAVSREEVQRVAARYLNPALAEKRPYVTGYLLPPRPKQTTEEEAGEAKQVEETSQAPDAATPPETGVPADETPEKETP